MSGQLQALLAAAGVTTGGSSSPESMTFGSPAVFESAESEWISCCYDSTNDTVVIAYSDVGNSGYGTAVVGTVVQTGITFGTPVVFSTTAVDYTACCFDSTNDKVVIAFMDGTSSHGKAIVGTVSGTAISYGTEDTFEAAAATFIGICFDSNNGTVVVSYRDQGNSNYGTSAVGTVSGTGISFGTPVVYASVSVTYTNICFDSNANKVVVVYRDTANSCYGTAAVGTASGTAITFGTPVVFDTTDVFHNSCCFDSNSNTVVIAYSDNAGAINIGNGVVGTVAGTSISFGTPVVFNNAATKWVNCCFDSNANNVVIVYEDDAASDYGTAITAAVSGDVISYGSEVVFESAAIEYAAVCYDSTAKRIVVAFQDEGNSNYGTSAVGIVGSYGLSFGTAAVFESAAVDFVSCGYDPVNERVVVAYQDEGNSDKGTAAVGTVSGTGISFGTPVVFEQGGTFYTAVCFDSVGEKIIIAYRDTGNSHYGTAIVGTVSGTSISFGTAVVFNAGTTNNIACCYDTVNEKVVITYTDVSSSEDGMGIVGTVSGTAISFGSENAFDSNVVAYTDCCYDSVNGKIVIVYTDQTNGYYGTGIIGTVSGTSISYGSEAAFAEVATSNVRCCFDANAGKTLICYQATADADSLWTAVGTTSGTSISFGTVVDTGKGIPNGGYNTFDCCYDSNLKRNIISYADAGNSSYGTSVVAVISGTSVIFGTPVVFESAAVQDFMYSCFDSTTNQFVPVYADGGNSSYGTAIVGVIG